MSCLLCERKPINKIFYEDEKWWVTVCANPRCGAPMIVLKEHRVEISGEEREEAERILRQLTALLDTGRFRYDDKLRTIRDHYHGHLR